VSTPATRDLAVVLRALTRPDAAVRLLVGTYGPPLTGPDARTYANVILEGVPVVIPRLAGPTEGQEGQPAYILASPGRMLVLGTVQN
jgi:hypothetical protein